MAEAARQYEPVGPLKGLTYGNGIVETRSFDFAGRLSGIENPRQNCASTNMFTSGAGRPRCDV